jgi:hypothetical protein
MATDWHIVGESGTPWNATARTLESLQVAGGTVRVGSWDADGMTLRMVSNYTNLQDLVVPYLDQMVELRRSSSASDVFFRGWVTGRRSLIGDGGRAEMTVEVSGAHYWLRKAAVQASVQYQHALAPATRSQIMTSGAAATSLASLIAIAQAAYPGKIYSHSIGTLYNLPAVTISDADVVAGIMDILRWLPDAHAWWDYPASQAGNTFRVARKSAMAQVSLALNGSSGVVSAEFNPRPDQGNSEGVTIDYARVIDDGTANTGKIQYLTQTSGGGRVRVTTAGPEIDTYVPDSPVDSCTLTTTQLTAGNILANYGSAELRAAVNANQAGGIRVGRRGVVIKDEETGQALSGYNYLLVNGETKDWLPQRGVYFKRVKVTLEYWSNYAFAEIDFGNKRYVSNTYTNPQSYSCPLVTRGYSTIGDTMLAWLQKAEVGATDAYIAGSGQYYIQGTLTFCPGVALTRTQYVERIEVTGVALTASYNGQTYYRPPDYDFAQPPTDLAANLSAAQNWTPVEGSAQIVRDSPGSVVFTGRRLVFTSGQAEWLWGETPVVEHSIDLTGGKETVRTAAPSRLGHLGIQNRISRRGQDNIRWL